MDPIVSIRLSKHESQFGIVRAVEEVISSLPNGYIIDCNGKPVDNVYVRGALSYSARIMSDPWSASYPTKQEVIATCAKDALVEVILWDNHLNCKAV